MLVFDTPLAYVLLNVRTNTFCAYCLKKFVQDSILCQGCSFAQYCNEDCQRKACNGNHRKECSRLQQSFPNLPTSEVMLMARLVDNVRHMKECGDTEGWTKYRQFEQLMTHEAQIRSSCKLDHFNKVYEKTVKFIGAHGVSLDKEEFWEMFCKVAVNSFSIKTPLGLEIGISLDLGVSRYDHSCKPNCMIYFEGKNAILRPLTVGVDVDNVRTAFISYIDVARSKFRRQMDLKNRWYFNCECCLCESVETGSTSVRCEACTTGAIPLEEQSLFENVPACEICGNLPTSDYIEQVQQFMISLPHNFSVSNVDQTAVQAILPKAEKLLSENNVYLVRLKLLSVHLMTAAKQTTINPELMHGICGRFERFLPPNDPRLACQLLHVIRNYCMREEYLNALPLVVKANNIFKVIFGDRNGSLCDRMDQLVTMLQSAAPPNNFEIFSLIDLHTILY